MTAVLPVPTQEGGLGYEDLERRLGDPREPANVHGFAALARRDAGGRETTLAATLGADLQLAFVPPAAGGTMRGVDHTLMLARLASRRDATVMPATMFGITATTAVLVGGDAGQRAEVVGLAARGESIGFALTEPDHDADLLAGECALTPDPAGGYRLNGRKWRVGLGPTCTALLVVARTGGRGPGAFSLVLVRGGLLDRARRGLRGTDGMRGVEFADLVFDDVPVPASDVVGGLGRGMEITLRAMQLVRVMSTAANLGTADTALRLTLDATLGAGPDTTDPHVRRELGVAAAALAAADVTAVVSARALHTLPGQQSLGSAVVKRVLTDLSREVFDRCADVLGFRSLLAGPFAVAQRDNAVVRHIDTDPVATLRLIAQQLRRIALAPRGCSPEGVAATFDLDAELPDFDPAALALTWRGGDAVVDALPAVVALLPAGPVADRAAAVVAELDVLLAAAREPADRESGAPILDLAERFAFAHAAASAVLVWWHNRHAGLFGQPPGATGWLVAVLDLLLDRAAGRLHRPAPATTDGVLDTVTALHRQGRLFGAAATVLAEGDRS